MRPHCSIHIDLESFVDTPLPCEHDDGTRSFRVVNDHGFAVWLTGSTAEFMEIAARVAALADVEVTS